MYLKSQFCLILLFTSTVFADVKPVLDLSCDIYLDSSQKPSITIVDPKPGEFYQLYNDSSSPELRLTFDDTETVTLQIVKSELAEIKKVVSETSVKVQSSLFVRGIDRVLKLSLVHNSTKVICQ